VTQSDDVSITIQNQGPSTLSGAVLAEWINTPNRAFGNSGNMNLSVKPYIVVGAESAGDPPQPPFVTPAVTLTVYARLTGNDTSGKGTLALPYRTFQRAIRDVPNFIPPGINYVVDCTDLGTEVLPADFVMPSWKSAMNMFAYDIGREFSYISTAVRVLADPKLASSLAPADAVINAAVITADPITGYRTYTVGAPRAGWGPGLVGLLAHNAGDVFANARIIAATATSITVLSDFDWTFPALDISIREPSFALQTTQTDAGFANTGLQSSHQGGMSWVGVDFIADTANFFGSIGVFGGWTNFECCTIQSFGVHVAPPFCEFIACLLDNFGIMNCRLFSLGSRWTGFFIFEPGCFGSTMFNTQFDGCSPLDIKEAGMGGILIENGFSNGVEGSYKFLVNSIVRANAGYGVKISDNYYAHLQNVVGTGNGTGLPPGEQVGVKADSGAQVEVGSGVTVAGADGIYKAGDLPADSSGAPGAPFNAYDITSVSLTQPVTGATVAMPIELTVVGHSLSTGDPVFVAGVTGVVSANGYWRITVTGANTFELDGSDGLADPAYAGGGQATLAGVKGTGARIYEL
jgi:hypothetical protein